MATPRLEMAQPFLAAQSSTGKRPVTSVAVVTTAAAPRYAARRRARELAPPMWPERRGMTYCPVSSRASTAGSVTLLFTKGAISRTAMPQAPTKTMASAQGKSPA